MYLITNQTNTKAIIKTINVIAPTITIDITLDLIREMNCIMQLTSVLYEQVYEQNLDAIFDLCKIAFLYKSV